VRPTRERSCSQQLADWIVAARFEDIPPDVVAATRHRVLDVSGLALTGATTAFGKSVRASTVALHAGGPSRLVATGERVAMPAAAFANGAFSQALEFDDTHNESIVHMSSPSVSAALAIAEARPMTGCDFIAAVALGNEVSCRSGASRRARSTDAGSIRPARSLRSA
jgi:2-methylcitrate dehydratase PrpD